MARKCFLEKQKTEAKDCIPHALVLIISCCCCCCWPGSSSCFCPSQVMETKDMLYIVTEYAKNGEMFGECAVLPDILTHVPNI